MSDILDVVGGRSVKPRISQEFGVVFIVYRCGDSGERVDEGPLH